MVEEGSGGLSRIEGMHRRRAYHLTSAYFEDDSENNLLEVLKMSSWEINVVLEIDDVVTRHYLFVCDMGMKSWICQRTIVNC